MNDRLVYIPEPKLAFGYGQPMEDPRDGLTLFGPFDSLSPHRIQAGVIGTAEALELYRQFVSRLQQAIYSPFNKLQQRPHFPGFETVFGVQWSPNPDAFIAVNPADLEASLAIPNVKELSRVSASRTM